MEGLRGSAQRGVVHWPDPRCLPEGSVHHELRDDRRVLPGRGEGQPSDLLVHRAESVAQPQRHAPADFHAGARPGVRCTIGAARRGGIPGQDLRRDPLIVVLRRFQLVQHPADGRVRRARRDLRPRSSARRKPAGSGWTRGSDGLHLQPARCATAGDRDLALDLRTHGRQRRPPPHVGDPDDARTVEPRQAAHRAGRDRPRPRPVADPRQATSARGLARRLVSPQPVPDFDGSLIPLDAPLSPMAKMWAPLYSPPSSGSSATPPV